MSEPVLSCHCQRADDDSAFELGLPWLIDQHQTPTPNCLYQCLAAISTGQFYEYFYHCYNALQQRIVSILSTTDTISICTFLAVKL